MGCAHQNDSYNLVKDLCWVLLIALGVLILREFVAWYFKTNHVMGGVERNGARLDRIVDVLRRNGLQ